MSARRTQLESQRRSVAVLAEAQHGVVARRQLLDRGLRAGAIGRQVRHGQLHPVYRGVYAVGHRAIGPDGRWMAAVLAGGPGAVLSHRSAADAWGLRSTARQAVEITTPGRWSTAPGLQCHAAAVAPADVTSHRGLPITTPERTILDVSSVLRIDALRRVLDQAEVLRLVDWSVLARLTDEAAGRRGVRALRSLLTSQFSGANVTKSDLERDFLDLVRRSGLPMPVTNTVVDSYEADCVWRDAKLIVELDSRRFHLTTGAFEDDRLRDRTLMLAGWRVVRVTWRHIHLTPRELVADLVRLRERS